MTPAELLLAAADRIDQARAHTKSGLWQPVEWDLGHGAPEWCVSSDAGMVANCGRHDFPEAAWIALLNPQVGEHIAALLREAVSEIDLRTNVGFGTGPVVKAALALARAILGGDQ